MIGGLVMMFQTGGECGRGGVSQFVHDTNRPASFLERDLVGLGVNGNWQVWIRCCVDEAVSIHMVRKGMVGFSNVKSIIFSTLKLVD